MTFQTQLRIPGPTPLPERVVRSMNRPMIDHRGPEFAAILAEITAGAKRVFKTSHDLLLLTSSGTGGLESAIANLVSPGDEVVAALCGNFGERFAALAAAYGADVVRLEFEWGQPVDASDLAWAQQANAHSPRFYFDWKEAKVWAEKGMTPFTPAIGVVFALQEGLRMIEEEGLDNVYERNARLARGTQAGLKALGFQLYAQEGYRSNTVTSALPPPGLDVAALRNLLNEKYGVVIAGGQGKMAGKMIRVGHLGAIAEGDVVQVLWAIEQALEELDIAPAEGRGVAAVTASLQGVAAATR